MVVQAVKRQWLLAVVGMALMVASVAAFMPAPASAHTGSYVCDPNNNCWFQRHNHTWCGWNNWDC